MSVTLTILGCGSSGGVPRVGGYWGACDPKNEKNKRRRCSLLMEQSSSPASSDVTRILVDTSPDLRMQLLDAEVASLDGVLITHPHADHTHGLDDLRPLVLAQKRRMDLYLDERSSKVLRASFSYIFETPPGSLYTPLVEERRLVEGQKVELRGAGGVLNVYPFLLQHGDIDALGFRCGAMAYTPDLKDIPEVSLPYLSNLDLWIIDSLSYHSHPSHLSLAEALNWIERLQPQRAVLTNLSPALDYEVLQQTLPKHVAPAYDGMKLIIE